MNCKPEKYYGCPNLKNPKNDRMEKVENNGQMFFKCVIHKVSKLQIICLEFFKGVLNYVKIWFVSRSGSVMNCFKSYGPKNEYNNTAIMGSNPSIFTYSLKHIIRTKIII